MRDSREKEAHHEALAGLSHPVGRDRLLLTVQTSQGSFLVTFKKKVAEIDLLVQQGDTLTLALRRYEPFVDEPAIERVRRLDPTPRPKAHALPSSPGAAAP